MKNDNTYFLAYQASAGIIKKYYPPQVYPFEWQGIEFFVHRVLDGTDGDKPLYSTQFWQVSEKQTGMSLGITNATTIEDTKGQAVEKLGKVGIDKVKEKINGMKFVLR
jgi:hypothetical protein